MCIIFFFYSYFVPEEGLRLLFRLLGDTLFEKLGGQGLEPGGMRGPAGEGRTETGHSPGRLGRTWLCVVWGAHFKSLMWEFVLFNNTRKPRRKHTVL